LPPAEISLKDNTVSNGTIHNNTSSTGAEKHLQPGSEQSDSSVMAPSQTLIRTGESFWFTRIYVV